MQFDPILPQARVKAMKAQGYWNDLILTDYFDRSWPRCLTRRL